MVVLMHLLSSLVQPDGAVNVPRFYDRVRPLTPQEEAMYEHIDLDMAAYCEVRFHFFLYLTIINLLFRSLA